MYVKIEYVVYNTYIVCIIRDSYFVHVASTTIQVVLIDVVTISEGFRM